MACSAKCSMCNIKGTDAVSGAFAGAGTVHIVPELSEGTWLSSLNVMHFFGSSVAKDQLPGH